MEFLASSGVSDHRQTRPRRMMKLRSLESSLVVHTVAFIWFARVWLWHLTPAASGLPGAQGFGWFVRYLTFYSFTLQTFTLGLATMDDWGKLLSGRSHYSRLVDDLASSQFALAHVVTIMFYTIQTATKSMVEGGVERPPWLNVTVHLFNTLVAWADMVTAHRSFSRSSERLSSVLVFMYICYIQLCKQMNGHYPYPFLRNLRQPHGFIGTVVTGLLLFAGAFRVGKAINRRVRAITLFIAGHGDTITIQATKADTPRTAHAYALVRRGAGKKAVVAAAAH